MKFYSFIMIVVQVPTEFVPRCISSGREKQVTGIYPGVPKDVAPFLTKRGGTGTLGPPRYVSLLIANF